MTTPTDISADLERLDSLEPLDIELLLHILRNPHGWQSGSVRTVRNAAADRIEAYERENADLRREVERQSLVDGFTIHNASAVFAGKNIAYAFDRFTAALIAEHGNKQSKYQSDIRTAWIRHAAQPHMTWFWKDNTPAPEQGK